MKPDCGLARAEVRELRKKVKALEARLQTPLPLAAPTPGPKFKCTCGPMTAHYAGCPAAVPL